MKKTVMRAVRAALQLVPKSLKNKLKQNERLTGFYIKSVRKSGLFFDAPTPKQTHKLYQAWLHEHHSLLSEQNNEALQSWQVIIVGSSENFSKTEQNVLALGAASVFFINDEDKGGFLPHKDNIDINLPILLLKSGDTVHAGAIARFLDALKSAGIVFSDTDEALENGEYTAPRFLPDWNPELQLSTGYVRTGVMLKADYLETVDCLTSIAGLLAKLTLSGQHLNIKHISLPLVHSCFDDNETARDLAVIRDEIESSGDATTTLSHEQNVNKVMWKNTSPLVSLIIPTKNGKQLVQDCVESILEKTTYSNYEILLIDNGSDEKESLDYFDYLNTLPKIRVLQYPGVFNYSAINNFGVQHAMGSVVGLVNNDIEVITPEWLTYLVGHVERESVGCVGAKLLYSDTRIQHAGVVLGYGGGAGHAHKNFPRTHSGYLKRICATNNFSAVTAACLLVKKSHFDAVNGLNENDLAVAFNDVDFCLRVEELGVRNVYCAEAELFHHESVSRGLDISQEKAARFNKELTYLKTKWSKTIENDPAYSPNLTLKRENFSVRIKEEIG
ncbi:glycosyltransferase family 2 protein [Alteromonas sp. P256]|uniref:glycosyltransferase family 2 protein n=1 Tax=Alteromonas sp. P256 TaxID=3117399 RepID=UPI002FE3FA99